MRFFCVFNSEMNYKTHINISDTIKIKQKETTMKTPNNLKNKFKKEKDILQIAGGVNKPPHNERSKKSKKSFRKESPNPDYIDKLIELYYDNDKNAMQYLESAHKQMYKLQPQNRLIVIGDIHGDFDVAIECLILAGCISTITPPSDKTVDNMNNFFNNLKWIGGSTYVIQLGDQIDRIRPQSWDSNSIANESAFQDEGTTLEIFYLFWHINNLAYQQGGRVFCIIGNHEIMNVEGDFRYVSRQEFRSFKDHLKYVYHNKSKYPYNSRTLKNARDLLNSSRTKKFGKLKNSINEQKQVKLPDGYRERLYAFSPTGLCANFLGRNYYTMIQIGSWLFCHGSPTMDTVKTYSIDLINSVTSMYLLGLESEDKKIQNHFDNLSKDKTTNHTTDDSSSILWSRTFGESPTSTMLEQHLTNILETYNQTNNNNTYPATHIAIGHTPQRESGINSICNGRVWRCDIGMSKAFITDEKEKHIPRKIQVLEIINNTNPRVLSS